MPESTALDGTAIDAVAPAQGAAAAPIAVPKSPSMKTVWGVLLATAVVGFSSTSVASSLPRIVGDLHGSQTSYAWVFSITVLVATVATPIWGRLADVFSRKLLLQLAIMTFVCGSCLAGLSTSTSLLIAFRVIQGVGVGGVFTLCIIVLSDICTPRERGKYMGMLGASQSIATLAGPLIGGLITDSPLGWRWNFYIGVPVAVTALITLQRTLHLPERPLGGRKVTIDYAGSALIAFGVTDLLIWVSFAGDQFAWASAWTAVLVAAGVAMLVGAFFVERRAKDPVIPLRLFNNRTLVLAVIGSTAVGVALFGVGLFLSEYLQIARGRSVAQSSLLTIPMVVGSIFSSIVLGRVITRTGHYKRWMLFGGVSLACGAACMSQIGIATPFVLVSVFLVFIGAGVGALQENLILAVQNVSTVADMATASSTVNFFKMMGGAAGVAVMGAVLSSRVDGLIKSGLRAHSLPADSVDVHSVPKLSSLSAPVREVVQSAYAQGVSHLFIISTCLALIALTTVILIPEVPLGTKSGLELRNEELTSKPE
jgi:MFS family permease